MSKTATQAALMMFFRPVAVRLPYAVKYQSPVAKARLAIGLTKKDAARLAGVSLRTYERVEAGDSEASRFARKKVCRALGMAGY